MVQTVTQTINHIQTYFSRFPITSWFVLYLAWTMYVLRWFWGMHPMNHAGVDSVFLSFVLVLFAWLSVSLAISLSILPLLSFSRSVNIPRTMIPYVYASLWVLVEILGSLFFFVLTYAEQSLWGPHYTFVHIGYYAAHTPLNSLLAPLGGIYLLSWVMVFAAATTLIAIRYRTIPWLQITLLISLIILGLFYRLVLDSHVSDQSSLVAALRVDSSPTFGIDNFEHKQTIATIDSLIGTLVREESIDTVVLGEDSRYLQEYQRNVRPVPHQATIIDSGRTRNDDMVQSIVYVHEPTAGTSRHYEKQLLVSEGEYLSWYYRALATVLGQRHLVHNFENNREYSRGDYHAPTTVNEHPWAVTMCSELYSPLIQSHLSVESSLIVNLASHSVLRGHPGLEQQTERVARVRATENNRYLVRSNNSAPAFVIDNHGTIISHSLDGSYATARVEHINKKTLFSQSPWLVPLLSLLIIGYVLLGRKRLQ